MLDLKLVLKLEQLVPSSCFHRRRLTFLMAPVPTAPGQILHSQIGTSLLHYHLRLPLRSKLDRDLRRQHLVPDLASAVAEEEAGPLVAAEEVGEAWVVVEEVEEAWVVVVEAVA